MDYQKAISLKIGITTIALVLVISTLDWLFHQEVVWSMLFIAPVTVSFFHPNKRFITFISAACSVISITMGALMGHTFNEWMNQLISIAGIWSAWFGIVSYRGSVDRLSKERERLKALFDYSTEGIVIADKNGEIVMINPTAEKKFGFETGELIGMKIETLIPDRFGKGHVRHRDHFIKNPHARPMGKGLQLYARKKDGSEFPVEISLSTFTIDHN
ncbi:MAG: PAS domain S-box protein, partial [Bacteroidota bacterium]